VSALTECATPGCRPRGGDGPATAADGVLICPHHISRLGVDALHLPGLYDDLAAALTASDPSDDNGTPGRGVHPGLRLNIAAAQARHDIRRLLIGTVQTIATVRGILPPQRAALSVPLPPGVEGPLRLLRQARPDGRKVALAAYVAEHRMWLAGQPDAGAISDAYSYARRRAWAICHGEPPKTVHIGTCPMLVDGEVCGAPISSLIRATDQLLPLAVTCEQHPGEHQWQAGELARLGRWIGLKQGRWMSTAELSVLYGLPLRRIHQLASIYQWERTRDGLRPVLYSAASARVTPELMKIMAARVTMVETDGRPTR